MLAVEKLVHIVPKQVHAGHGAPCAPLALQLARTRVGMRRRFRDDLTAATDHRIDHVRTLRPHPVGPKLSLYVVPPQLVFGVIHMLTINSVWGFYQHDVIKSERNFSGFVMLLMFYRFSNYMSLIERFSPFIDHMYNVFTDIAFFFLLLLIVVLVFTFNFYLIAQNQIDFDIEAPTMSMSMDKK